LELLRDKLIASLKDRIELELAAQNPVKFIRSLDVGDLIDQATFVIYLYTRSKKSSSRPFALMTEVMDGIRYAYLKHSGKAQEVFWS